MEQQSSERFEGWCICEIMGHQTFAGYVTERAIAGAGMLQIDVPAVDEQHPAFTKFFSPASIYAITPTTEAQAREAAAQIRVRPVTLYIPPEPKRLAVVADRYTDPDAEYSRYDDDSDDDDDPDDDDGFEGDDDEIDDVEVRIAPPPVKGSEDDQAHSDPIPF